MSKIKQQGLNIKKLYRSINWDHKTKTDMLEPTWKPNIVKVIESGDKVVNNDADKVKKKEERKAEKQRRNNQGICKSVKGRAYKKRIKVKRESFEKFIENKIESSITE